MYVHSLTIYVDQFPAFLSDSVVYDVFLCPEEVFNQLRLSLWGLGYGQLRYQLSTRPGVRVVGWQSKRALNYIYIQSFKVGRVGDEELFGKLQVNVSPMFECSSQTGETPLRSSATAGTSG